MVHKRAFSDEDSCEIACKYPRQIEYASQPDSMVGVVPCNDSPREHQTSDGEGEDCYSKFQDEGSIASDSYLAVYKYEDGEGEDHFNKFQEEGRIASDSVTKAQEEFASSAPYRSSSFLWVNSSEDNVKSEPASHLSFFPEYFEFDHHVRPLIHSNELSLAPEHPSQKEVSVGPDHQAYVPEWSLHGVKSHMDDEERAEKLTGTCIIPSPDLESYSYDSCQSRSECNCFDRDSIRCVRQHVSEAREKLREYFGHEIFKKLGFCDIGEEVVAQKWTEDEEQIFFEVVHSYPASGGKNFWDHLLESFPSRTKNELVSYYFNVFMLRKRAEQNRFDPINIDSDNDEWPRNEVKIAEEEEHDSGFVYPS